MAKAPTEECPPGEAEYAARSNLLLAGRQIAFGSVVCLPIADREVQASVAVGHLIPASADGTFVAAPPPRPRACCGG